MAKAPKPRTTARTASKKAKPADDLTVSLDEFAALCGVTPETMRSHLKTSPPDAEWMRVRGRPGVGYQIEAKGALAWYRSRGTGTGAGTDEIRQQRLAELRAQMLGDGDGGDDEGLILTGKQRYDEFRAGRAALDYLAEIKVLVRADEMEDATVNAVIELRRQLQEIGPRIRKKFDLPREAETAIETTIAESLAMFVKKLDEVRRPAPAASADAG